MRVLLLLAGRSERFWPLPDKTLFPLCQQSILGFQIERLRQAGLTEITLVVGPHNRTKTEELFPGYPIIEQEDMTGGTRAALLSALPHCGSESVFVVCGNDVVTADAYRSVIDTFEDDDVDGALLAQRRDRYFPGGYLTVDGERVINIVEKPGEGNQPSDLVNIEIHAHRDASVLLKALQTIDNTRDDGYEQALQSLFTKNHYRAVPYEGFWQAVKYPWHLLDLLPHFLDDIRTPRIHPSAQIHPTAVIDGPVIIGEGVQVFAHATVRGPCVIGAHTIIANNTLVRGSSIGDHCVIGFGSEVKGSVLADHVWTHMTYLGDSIIANNVSFGSGCATGNLRLDEGSVLSVVKGQKIDTHRSKLGTIVGDHVRIGIQTGFNPGVKIGTHSMIVGGVLVMEDVPERSFVDGKDGTIRVRENRTDVPTPESRAAFRKAVEGK